MFPFRGQTRGSLPNSVQRWPEAGQLGPSSTDVGHTPIGSGKMRPSVDKVSPSTIALGRNLEIDWKFHSRRSVTMMGRHGMRTAERRDGAGLRCSRTSRAEPGVTKSMKASAGFACSEMPCVCVCPGDLYTQWEIGYHALELGEHQSRGMARRGGPCYATPKPIISRCSVVGGKAASEQARKTRQPARIWTHKARSSCFARPHLAVCVCV